MYDTDNMGYYCDPAGTSSLNRFTAANCQICLYWCDSNCGVATSATKRCVSMASNATGNVSTRMDLGGDVDSNDDMWLGFECP